jgi:hypothetical protein
MRSFNAFGTKVPGYLSGKKKRLPNLRTRVAALERWAADRQDLLKRAMIAALPSDRSDLELLLSALGADVNHRPLTDREAEVRRAYEQSLEQHCRSNGIRSPAHCDHSCYLSDLRLRLWALNPCLDLELIESAFAAQRDGRTPTAAESEALSTGSQDWERISDIFRGLTVAPQEGLGLEA